MFSRNRPDRDDRKVFVSYTSGRSGRAEFWLCLAGALVAATVAHGALGKASIFSLFASSFGALSIFVRRRLHDFGQSGWWAFAPLALFAALGLAVARAPGSLILVMGLGLLSALVGLVFIGAMPGDKEPNRYGAPSPMLRKRRSLA